MNTSPKRRWYQFSLRTLLFAMALVGVVLGIVLPWRAHRQFCLERATFHDTEAAVLADHDFEFQFLSKLFESEGGLLAKATEQMFADIEKARMRAKSHRTLADAYQHAVWRPWERYWIEDPYIFPPPDAHLPASSEGVRKLFNALSKQDRWKENRELDAVRRKLADEAREKYGVP